MSPTLQELKDAASGLPLSERAELAQFLLGSLDEQDEQRCATEWLALAELRMVEIRAGGVVGVPAEKSWKTSWGRSDEAGRFSPRCCRGGREAAGHYENLQAGLGDEFGRSWATCDAYSRQPTAVCGGIRRDPSLPPASVFLLDLL